MEGDEVFARSGHQDITADVNFTDLIDWGEAEFRWNQEPLITQGAFLRRWAPGITKLPENAAEYLLSEDGMGGAFKALVQSPIRVATAKPEPDDSLVKQSEGI